MSGSPSSSSNSRTSIVLISSDGESFKVDYEALALQSKAIKLVFEVSEGDRRCYEDLNDVYLLPLQLYNVSSRLLLKIVDYCMKHYAVSSPEELKDYDSEFVNVDHNTLVRLIIAANGMAIRNILDLSLIHLINEMSPEDICNLLDLNPDLPSTEVHDLYITYPWAFQQNKQRISPTEFAHLTIEEKGMMEKESFMRKVLPALSPAEFTYLTLEEKKEWVLVAVLLSHLRAYAPSKLYQNPTDGKEETDGLDGKSVRQEEGSESIRFDLTSLSFEESKNENSGSRNRVFQLFSACVYFRTDKPGGLYGAIGVKGSGCSGYISFFNRGESQLQLISNKGLISLTDPSPYGLISATGMVKMKIQLFVRLNDDDLKLSLEKFYWDCRNPDVNEYSNHFENAVIKEKDGYVKLYYMVLDHPVEATVELDLKTNYSFSACGKIVAYYGDLESYLLPHDKSDDENEGLESGLILKCGIEEAEYCKITLFEASRSDPILVQDGKIPLIRSKLVVPSGGSLVIEVDVQDLRLRQRNVKGICEFKSKLCGRSTGLIDGLRCKMALKVNWKHHEE